MKLNQVAGAPNTKRLTEDPFEKAHPTLTRGELATLEKKFDRVEEILEQLQAIFKLLSPEELDVLSTHLASNAHHIIHKGGGDHRQWADFAQEVTRMSNKFSDLHMEIMGGFHMQTDPDFD